MENSQHILSCSIAVVAILGALINVKLGWAAYASTLGSQNFTYKFDRSKLSFTLVAVAVLFVLSLGYGLIISQDIPTAFIFSLGAVFFGGLSLMLRIMYLPQSKSSSKK